MANFKGFKVVTKATYVGTAADERKDYLWFVRELSGSTVVNSEIYFGNRLYANVGEGGSEEALNKVNALIAAMGDAIDADGNFLGFLPTEEHEILAASGVTDITLALEALESAILANKDAIEGKVSIEDYEAKVAELEEKIENAGKVKDVKVDGTSVLDENGIANIDLTGKADKEDVYTKEEVDGKFSGLWHFKGTATGISEDNKTIYVGDEEIVAAAANEGWVFELGEDQYASNAEIWVKLGTKYDLSQYATKEYVDDIAEAASEEITSIKNVIGDAELPAGTTLTSGVNNLLAINTIEGDDVE